MFEQTLQLFNCVKALVLATDSCDEGLKPLAVKSTQTHHPACAQQLNHQLSHKQTFTCSHQNGFSGQSEKNTSVRHARNFLINAVAISICMTALLLSMDALPVIFKVIAFCGSLMVGFIIEIMLNGDEYE